jgi:SprT protein
MDAIPTLYRITEETLWPLIEKAILKYEIDFRMPKIEFGIRGRIAGRAFLGQNRIQFNEQLFCENVQYFKQNTIGHEFAHLVAFEVYGSEGSGHGPRWKQVMRDLGLAPNRTHGLNVTLARATRQFRYICACQKLTLGVVRHRRFQMGVAYRCGKCKKTLAFLHEI